MSDYDQESGEIIEPNRAVTAVPPQIVPMASPSCAEVWGALSIAQGSFESPKRTKEATVDGQTAAGRSYSYKYKYAPLEEIERVIRAPLAENHLFRQQYLVSRNGQWFIRTMIGHSSGEWIACDYPIFASKQGAQGFASGVTYARRYGLSLALGLAPEDDDDAAVADSAPVSDGGARQAQEGNAAGVHSAGATRTYQRAPQAAPGNPAYDRAVAGFRKMQADVDACDSVEKLVRLSGEPRDALLELMKTTTPSTWEAGRDKIDERIANKERALKEMDPFNT